MLLDWKDSRVTFRNLKTESYLNTVGSKDAEKIWYPKVLFYNTENMEETKVKNETPKVKRINTSMLDSTYPP
jgi:hypothetical protein